MALLVMTRKHQELSARGSHPKNDKNNLSKSMIIIFVVLATLENVSCVQVTVNPIGTSATCQPNFLSVALSSRSIDKGRFDKNSDKLKNMAAALEATTLRIGGTMANYLTFDANSQETPPKMLAKWQPFTLTGAQWSAMGQFVDNVGWDILFDLNQFLRTPLGQWDPSNAEEFLRFSSEHGVRLSGFQIGNEVSSYAYKYNGTRTVSPQQMVEDIKAVKKLMLEFPEYSKNPLYGPDIISMGDHPSSRNYMRAFLEAGGGQVVDMACWHHYYLDAKKATVEEFYDADVLDTMKTELDTAAALIRQHSPGLPLVLTETSSCYGGGARGISDRYAAGFLWLDKLGLCAQYNVSTVHRQAFYGGESYNLIGFDRQLNVMWPNPDFFLSVLYKRLVLGPVLSASAVPESRQLRLYAHCARRDFYNYPDGAVVIYFLNLEDQRRTLTLTQYEGQEVDLFLLTPGDDSDMTSKKVRLNGDVLLMQGDQLPPMTPKTRMGDVKVTGRSFGFIVVPNAKAAACRSCGR